MIRRALSLALCLHLFATPLAAGPQEDRLEQLFSALKVAKADEYPVIEQEIRAIWADSGSPMLNLLLERGSKALEDGDAEAAIEHFTALIDHAPEFAAAWNGRATAFFSAGLYGPALSDIAHVLALEPRHFGALTGLAVILEEAGKNDLALQAYQQVLQLNPNRADVLDAVQALERARGGFDT